TGEPYLCGDVQSDERELIGVREGLGVQSSIAVVIVVGERRGVLSIASLQPQRFDEADLRFVETVARWLGILIHRTELVERVAQEAASQARKIAAEEIVTIVAHDLRNHLAAIHGRLHLIGARSRKDGRAQDQGDADQALRVLARLRSMVSDMLDLSRLGRGSLVVCPEPLDLVMLVQETVDLLRAPNLEITITGPESLVVGGDPLRLRQVLENLLGNAIKHSPTGAPVFVMLAKQARGADEFAVVSVKDSGPGVDPRILPRLFDRFTTGPGSSGLGLGLYIARGITEAHGGTLTVESAPGQGATFSLALPLTA
ncbi:MAG TPA: HAMP domain-containing sensor histidine kinase, partial [Nannocystis sp.]